MGLWPSLNFFSVELFHGCASPPLFSYVVYENPTSFVRLEVSSWADNDLPETWNTHPVTLSRRQMYEALARPSGAGVSIVVPNRWVRGMAEMEPLFSPRRN